MTRALSSKRATALPSTHDGALPAETVLTQLHERGIRTVILGGADTHGIMRGKRVPVQQLQRLVEHGMPMCDVFWILHVDESDLVLAPADHAGYFPTEKK